MAKKRRRIKRRLRVDRILILLLILGIIGFGLYFGITHLFKSDDTDNSNSKPSVKEEDKTYELSLVMVGDNLIHDKIYNEALKNGMGNTYDFKPMLKEIRSWK